MVCVICIDRYRVISSLHSSKRKAQKRRMVRRNRGERMRARRRRVRRSRRREERSRKERRGRRRKRRGTANTMERRIMRREKRCPRTMGHHQGRTWAGRDSVAERNWPVLHSVKIKIADSELAVLACCTNNDIIHNIGLV